VCVLCGSRLGGQKKVTKVGRLVLYKGNSVWSILCSFVTDRRKDT